MSVPLADRMRPDSLDDVVGQAHLVGKNGILRKIISSGNIPNMIFYGPSGVGKTTVARIIAATTNKRLYKLNGTAASTADIKDVIGEVGTLAGYGGVLLYLDEIQYLNKKQQQSLLEHIENGNITLIASTTENPYFYIYNAILSRCTVFEFKSLEKRDVVKAVERAYRLESQELGKQIDVSEEVMNHIASACGGDVRKALNAVDLSILSAEETTMGLIIEIDTVRELTQRSNMRYDRDADEHFDIMSGFQKSIRGSDPDAALHYMGRLLEGGDLPSACRRLLVTASEDIGLAFPQAISIVKSCVDSALQLGLPEARIPLAEAVILLCTAPKSNSAIIAIDGALEDIRAGLSGDVPTHLKDAHYAGAAKMGRGIKYKYPHDFPDHYTPQQYLPDSLKDKKYYSYGDNKYENSCREYWDKIKRKK